MNIGTRGPMGFNGHLCRIVSKVVSDNRFEVQKWIHVLIYMNSIVRKVMHTKFGQNWHSTFQEAENMNVSYACIAQLHVY